MKKKVLVVDDSQGWINFHLELLRGFFPDRLIIDTAKSAREGYKKVFAAVNTPYDLIISDLHMEDSYGSLLAGEWFVERIRELKQYASSKIILISAMYNIKQIADELGTAYVSKSSVARDGNTYKFAIEELIDG